MAVEAATDGAQMLALAPVMAFALVGVPGVGPQQPVFQMVPGSAGRLGRRSGQWPRA